MTASLLDHLATGTTTLCRCWRITRADGTVLGFTDHDRDVEFDGVVHRASAGLTAQAVQQSTGLSVDNTEALGVLSDEGLSCGDIEAGRYDGASVEAWLVNWEDPSARRRHFRGTIGDIERSGRAFRAEVRGLSDALNRPGGRIYQKPCAARLGDAACGVDLGSAAYSTEGTVVAVAESRIVSVELARTYEPRWFERGRLVVIDGTAAGLSGAVKEDVKIGTLRTLGLWEALRAPLVPGARVRLEAGCDKRPETCRAKFGNFMNFRGFPHIPGEDWQMSYPSRSDRNDGGRLGE